MRGVAVLALAFLALVACASLQASTAEPTALRISFWKTPGGPPDARWTLRCNPARGTLPRSERACTRLARGGRALFLPVPEDSVCTEIYGGPQRARVVGIVAGKRVWVTFNRTNGCHIHRWDRLSPWLLPPGGVG
jgi:hypothetical protein